MASWMFPVVIGLFGASFALHLMEFIGCKLFWRWAFAYGFVLLRRRQDYPQPTLRGMPGATEHGVFRMLSGRELVLRERWRWPSLSFRPFAYGEQLGRHMRSSPQLIKASVRFRDGQALLELRAPLGATFFAAIWLGALLSVLARVAVTAKLAAVGGALAVGVLMIGFFVVIARIQKRVLAEKVELMFQELLVELKKPDSTGR